MLTESRPRSHASNMSAVESAGSRLRWTRASISSGESAQKATAARIMSRERPEVRADEPQNVVHRKPGVPAGSESSDYGVDVGTPDQTDPGPTRAVGDGDQRVPVGLGRLGFLGSGSRKSVAASPKPKASTCTVKSSVYSPPAAISSLWVPARPRGPR